MTEMRAPMSGRRSARPRGPAIVSAFVLAGLVAAAGCAEDGLRPAGTSESAGWFAAAPDSDVGDSYDPYYERTGLPSDLPSVGADQAETLNRLGAAAEAGDLGAAYELGKAYRYGSGVPANTQRAAHWLMAALAQPHDRWAHAAYQLGTMYGSGEGVPRDLELAQDLLLAAADLGYARAGLPLAQLYAEGRGVEKDLPRAEKLALHSAESGDVESHLWLLRSYQPDGLLGEHPRQADLLGERLNDLLATRAAANDARAMRDLALIRYQGLGVTRDRDAALRLLERAAQLQHPEYLARFGEDIAKGRNGFSAEPREGFYIMRQAADRYGDADAMSMVAEAYASGLGIRRDPVAAENWFRRAINAGSSRAAVAYGRMLLARENDPAAQRRGVEILEQAAAGMAPSAWTVVGKLHLEEALPAAEPSRGIVYLERAHLAGDPAATAALGEAYLEGRGVQQDEDKGIALLQRAADAGQATAMLALGEAYYEGSVLPQRPELAKQWLQKADAAGAEEARLLLGRGLLSGDLPGDPAEGANIVASFAQARNVEAMMALARAMRDGRTVPRDREAARRWFANAVQAGHPDARPELAAMLYQEGSQQQDLAQLQEAAELGHPAAMSRVGHAYLLGQGAPPDPARGSLWLERAVEAGSVSAAQTLGSAYLRGEHGLSHDPAQARRLLETAAAEGDTAAERDLGAALINPGSSGLPSDPRRGLQLLTSAAEKGDGRAMELLGRFYLEGGKGIPPQPEAAEVWLTRAAEKGFGNVPTTPQAASLDPDPEPEPPQDVDSLKEATDEGDQSARMRLATLYLFGNEGVQAQPYKGEEMLRPAVRDGDASAMLVLGLAYLHGSFGERRIDEGASLLFEAARAGNPTARNVLTRTVLHAHGLEEADRAEAEAWLDTRLTGDPEAGVATLTAMLREGLSDAPISASQAIDDEATER